MDNLKVVILGAGRMGVEIGLTCCHFGSQGLLFDLRRKENPEESLSRLTVQKAKSCHLTDPVRISG